MNPPAAVKRTILVKRQVQLSVLLGEGLLGCDLSSCRFHHGSEMADRS